LSPIPFDRALKAKLITAQARDFGGMDDQLPCGLNPRCRWLCLPELNIESAIQFFEFAPAHHRLRFHLVPIIPRLCHSSLPRNSHTATTGYKPIDVQSLTCYSIAMLKSPSKHPQSAAAGRTTSLVGDIA
jgi:hypothetical protein